MDLFAGVPREGRTLGEPCWADEEGCELSLLFQGPSSAVSVGWDCLRDEGRLGRVGEGNGDPSLRSFEVEIGASFLGVSFWVFLSASSLGGEPRIASVMLLQRGDRQLQLVEGTVRYGGSAYMRDHSRPSGIWSEFLYIILGGEIGRKISLWRGSASTRQV